MKKICDSHQLDSELKICSYYSNVLQSEMQILAKTDEPNQHDKNISDGQTMQEINKFDKSNDYKDNEPEKRVWNFYQYVQNSIFFARQPPQKSGNDTEDTLSNDINDEDLNKFANKYCHEYFWEYECIFRTQMMAQKEIESADTWLKKKSIKKNRKKLLENAVEWCKLNETVPLCQEMFGFSQEISDLNKNENFEIHEYLKECKSDGNCLKNWEFIMDNV